MSIYDIVRTDKEIDDLFEKIHAIRNKMGSRYPGMTYEEGIMDTINWLTDKDEPEPLDEV